jgi:hypothetical protein
MNDDRPLNEEELRLATSRVLPAGAALDSETAALREGFLAFGTALEASAGPFDEEALVARLRQSPGDVGRVAEDTPIEMDSIPDSSNSIHGPSIPQKQNHERVWQIVIGAALAATALIAIVRITKQSPTISAVVSLPQPKHDSSQAVERASLATSLAFWNDSLDDEIALAAVNLEQLAERNRGFDGSLLQMNERLEALSQELSAESL